MWIKTLCLASGLAVVVGLVWTVVEQPPDQPADRREGPPRVDDRGGPGGRFRAGERGGPAALFPGGGLERALSDLKLAEPKKAQAEAAVKAHQENVRKLMDLARAELLLKLSELLDPQEFKDFQAATDRFRGGPRDRLQDFAGRGEPGDRFRGNRGRGGRRLTADDIVERIMSFDKNKDGKITKDELPERMQDLIARGDTNKDGALDQEEVKKLAADLARDPTFPGFADRRGPGDGFGPRGRGGRGGFGPGGGLERALSDLKLPDKKKEAAEAIVRAHQAGIPKLMDLARADLLLKLKGVLSEEEFKNIKASLDRAPGFGARPPVPPPAGGPRSEVERKLDRLQQELDSLRREIRR
jgi:EF hand domain-containing protein